MTFLRLDIIIAVGFKNQKGKEDFVVTYQQVLDLYSSAERTFSMFGVEAEDARDFKHLFQNVGRALCEQLGTEFGVVPPSLLPTLVLGHEATMAYNDLREWLKSKGITPQ